MKTIIRNFIFLFAFFALSSSQLAPKRSWSITVDTPNSGVVNGAGTITVTIHVSGFSANYNSSLKVFLVGGCANQNYHIGNLPLSNGTHSATFTLPPTNCSSDGYQIYVEEDQIEADFPAYSGTFWVGYI